MDRQAAAQAQSIAARAGVLLRELDNRVGYLNEVGLGYLTLERQARTLSGGEAQRIHLASALGNLLSATLYALDEPTVGLHAADSQRLLGVLRHLRDLGNTVVVVEHDPAMIAGADYVVELGPGGGREGGRLIAQRRTGSPLPTAITPDGCCCCARLPMSGVSPRAIRPFASPARASTICANLDVAIPLQRMVCVTGVSGSGKSTLVENVLYNNYLRRAGEASVKWAPASGSRASSRLARLSTWGRRCRRARCARIPPPISKSTTKSASCLRPAAEARRLGIKPRDFSFNVAGGRCDRCHGTGTVTVEMHFMADLEVSCEACDGRRFQSHILGLRYHGTNINQVLELTIDEARSFFAQTSGDRPAARTA